MRERTTKWTGALWVLAALALLGAATATSAAAQQFHVAVWGKDSWPGTQAKPFKTPHRAQQQVRLNTAGMTSNIVVNLHKGTYRLAQPLQLSDAAGDSGENGHRVVYRAYGAGTESADHVVISGGRKVNGWTLDDAGKDIWRADVGNLETRQLYVGGELARRAELGEPIPGTITLTEDGYETDGTAPQSWANPEDIEIAMKWFWYNEPHCGVAGVSGDETSTTITMDQPCFHWAKDLFSGQFAEYPPLDLTFLSPFPENSKTFLTEPGTYYLDRSQPGEHVLYYIPRSGEEMGTTPVVAPVLEKLVAGEGTSAAPLHDVTFRGLTFAEATWLEPSTDTGFVQVFAGLYEHGDPPLDEDPFNISGDARTMPGNVSFHESSGIVLRDNRFTRLGANGIELSLGTSDSVVKGNVIADVSGGGIEIGNRYPDTTRDEFNGDNLIANNWVHDVGIEYPGSAGIYAEMVQDVRIAHNQVNGTSYSGIVLGQYWLPGATAVNSGARIVENKVFDTLNAMADGGGIYTVAAQGTSWATGAVVRGNLTYDNYGVPLFGGENGGIGLYTDDESDYVALRDNFTYGNGFNAFGGCLPTGHLRLTDNFWDNPEPGWACSEVAETVVVKDNTLVSEAEPEEACAGIPACASIMENAGLVPAYQHLLSE